MPFVRDAPITGLSGRRKQLFAYFLDLCRSRGTRLRVVVTPYDPDYIRRLNALDGSYDRLVEEVVRFLKRLRKKHRFRLYDFSKIEKYGGKPLFIDEAHPTRKHSSLIVSKIFYGKTDAVHGF
jgi:hypothetical protein